MNQKITLVARLDKAMPGEPQLTSIPAHRFINHLGMLPNGEPFRNPSTNRDAVIGVSETEAADGQAFTVIVGWSAQVEAADTIDANAYVTVSNDGTGRAIGGDYDNHCGIALADAEPGELVEIRLLPHRWVPV